MHFAAALFVLATREAGRFGIGGVSCVQLLGDFVEERGNAHFALFFNSSRKRPNR